ncbi:MAG TPA: hypothetical protein VKY90_13760 [Candidatus Dormibacteraeota bacterium]|nr:hypothetical protein [Candidatus Dormibacteraeota bacterium]
MAVCLALLGCTAEYQGTVTVPITPSPSPIPSAPASPSASAPAPQPSSTWTPLRCRWAVVVLEKEREGESDGVGPTPDPARWQQLERLVQVTVCRDRAGAQDDPATPPPGSYDRASGTLTPDGCAWAMALLEEARQLHEQAIGQPPSAPGETQAEHDRWARQAADDDDQLIDLFRETCPS